MGWQWHQLDHMQIIFTSLQTENHAGINHHWKSNKKPLSREGWVGVVILEGKAERRRQTKGRFTSRDW